VGITGCSSEEVNPFAPDFSKTDAYGRRDTPVRVSQWGEINISRERLPEFAECVEYADLIADVTIVEWLGESEEGQARITYFKGTVNKVVKGNELEEVEIIQIGSSRATSRLTPLFKNGDRLLVFLREMEDGDEKGKFVVSTARLMAITEYKNDLYLVDRSIVQDFSEILKTERIDGELRKSINEEYRTHDPFLAMIRDEAFEAIMNAPDMVDEYKNNPILNAEEFDSYNDVFNYNDIIRVITEETKEEIQ
jgi:hypothetical protein